MIEVNARKTAILIVDDEESLRSTFQFFLENEGYNPVTTAADFKEAIQAVRYCSFDLIISDIVLEGQSGIDFLRKIRQMGIDCPVVMITGYPNVETAAEAVRLGAFDYLPKPVEKESLLKTARQALQQRRLEKEKTRAEQERERYRSVIETVFNSVSDGIITVDNNFDIIEMNPAAKIIIKELAPDAFEQNSITHLCGKEEFKSLKTNITQALQNNKTRKEQRFECLPAHGGEEKKVISVCSSPLRDGAGGIEGVVMVLRDVSPVRLIAKHGKRSRFHRFIGRSDTMQAVYTMIEDVGRVDLAVLITGESGTGKELAAEALHLESHRCKRTMVKVDCTSIPENLLESELFGHKKGSFTGADHDRMGRILQADGGTLFLDEIGDISPMTQLRLLRFLQENTFYPVGRDTPIQVDVRVIAATNVNLKEKVQVGEFREDLYFRLRVIDVMLPPLRERGEDVILLANHFINLIAKKINRPINGMSDQVADLLLHYSWPGNVREFEHVMERTCVLCHESTIVAKHLPDEIVNWQNNQYHEKQKQVNSPFSSPPSPPFMPSPMPAIPFEDMPVTERIVFALTKTGGNKAKAARLLGIDRTTLYRKIRELHLDLSKLDI